MLTSRAPIAGLAEQMRANARRAALDPNDGIEL